MVAGQRGRLGVYRRLMLTLGALAFLTVAVGSIGWIGFASIETSLEEQQAASLKDLRTIMTLAERSASLAAKAPTIADVRTGAQLAAGRADLEALLGEFRALAVSLETAGDPSLPTRVPAIVRLAGRLEGIVVNMIAVTGEGLDARSRLAGDRRAIADAAALIDDLQPDEGKPLSPAMRAATRALSAARAGLVAADTRGLAAAAESFDVAADDLARAAPDPDIDAAVAGLAGLFDHKRQDISASMRVRIFLAAVDRSSTLLTDQVKALAATVEADALERGETMIGVLRTSKNAVMIVAAACLIAGLLASSTVMRDVLSYLRGATEALTRLAGGDFRAAAPGADRRDEIGDLARALAVFRTQAMEREELTRRVAESAELLSAIFDNMTDGVSLFDADGRLKAWNPRFLALTGLPVERVREGALLADLLSDLFAAGVETRTLDGRAVDLARIVRGRNQPFAVLEQHFPDGRIVEIRAGAMPNGDLLASLTDLTERKRLEQHVRQAQRMEAVGQLTGGIAHDFNNILAAISGNLQMIVDDAPAGTPTRTRALRALDAAESGGATTQRLLAFARRQSLAPEPTDLSGLAAEVAELLSFGLGSGIVLTLDLADDLPPAMVDPGQMENALINLVFNARDAMPDGGRVTIATGARPDGSIGISVRDTGVGMPPDIAARAVEPFFTTKPFGSGSGLGLSMVYGFVRQTGGSIAIDSRPGSGTTVSIDLPAAPPEARTTAPGRDVPHPGDGRHVLLVEDDERVRLPTLEMIDSLGYRASGAATPEEALATVRRGGIDIVVTDVVLGAALDGRALAAVLRRERPGLPVIFCTGFPKEAGVEGLVLEKPYRRERLAAALAAQPAPMHSTSASNT